MVAKFPSQIGLSMETYYQELVVKHHIQPDTAQVRVLGHLQQLLDTLYQQQSEHQQKSIFAYFLNQTNNPIKSLYIFGEVGRGKSMLMDIFFRACLLKSKRRLHFHAFMQEVHDYIHHWRKDHRGDPLPALSVHIRQTSSLLCLDEFQVTNIADAMLLARLFTRLFDLGVVFVMTSNQSPDKLYHHGLQRELFLPFIRLLKQSANILELIGKEDYRLSQFKSMETVFDIQKQGRTEFLQHTFNQLTHYGNLEAKRINVKGRWVEFEATHGDILYSSFQELCDRALGAADYLAIVNEFKTIFIADIPRFSAEIRDQVRRFATLIDSLYDNKIKLIASFRVKVEAIEFEDSCFDFKRTRSRLIEMQSKQYFGR